MKITITITMPQGARSYDIQMEDTQKIKDSLPILIVAVSENDGETIRKVLMEEIYNEDGEHLVGLDFRRMDEYEILKFGDFERDYDADRDYTQPKK